MYKRLMSIAMFILILIVTGCRAPTEPVLPDAPAVYEYRIGPEDVLTISVWKNPELSGTVAVRPDGMISLPLLNDVEVAGATPEQLRDTLKEKLTAFVNNVEVSVIVKEIHSQKVSVLGQVSSPARYEFNSRMTVLDAIAMAGGLTPYAARKRIVILRKGQDGEPLQRLPFNYDEAADSNGAVGNFEVQPGDIVMVP